MKVLLVDHQADDARKLCEAAQRHPELKVIWQAHDAQETLAYLGGQGIFGNREVHPMPDILVIDTDLPDCDRLAGLQRRFVRLKIGVFTKSTKPECRGVAEGLGAHLFQEKTFEPEILERFLHWLVSIVLTERRERSR